MKKRNADHKVVQGREFEESTFGIDKDNLAHIFDILRNQLYGDPIAAILREYSTNAVDAQIESGYESEFIVTLPTHAEPVFSVRDFGQGLSPEDVMEVYCMYGTSTKRNSNAYNGMLGLGSKSGFAYCQSFTISSFYGGKKYIFNAYIDESLIGKVALMSELDTEEKDGIEIKIPVNPKDVGLFQEKAVRIYTYFDQKPSIKNLDKSRYGDLSKPSSVVEGDGWRMVNIDRYSKMRSYALMGNVAYPIDSVHLTDPIAKAIVESGVEVSFDIGDLQISASRESLQYTEITKRELNTRFNQIVEQLQDKFAKKIEKIDNIWDATIALGDINDFANVSSGLRNKLLESITWKGHKLDFYNREFKRTEHMSITQASHHSWRVRKTIENVARPSIVAGKKVALIENDNHEVVLAPKLQLLLSSLDDKGVKIYDTAYVLNFHGQSDPNNGKIVLPEEARNLWYTTHDWENVKMLKLSELPKPVVVRAPRKPIDKSQVFEFSQQAVGNSYNDAAHWAKKEVNMTTAKGCYVEINRWQPVGVNNVASTNKLKAIYDDLAILGHKLPVIYGVKTAFFTNKKKVGPHMKWLQDVLLEHVRLALENVKTINTQGLKRELERVDRNLAKIAPLCPGLAEDSPFKVLYNKFAEYQEIVKKNSTIDQHVVNLHKIADNLGIKGTTDEVPYQGICDELNAEFKKLKKAYPLLEHVEISLSQESYYNTKEKCEKHNKMITDYIAVIDENKKLKTLVQKGEK